MLRGAVGKVTWLARATTTVVGLAIMLALVFGVASTALGANGNNFILGVLTNTATAVTKLTGNVSGKPALQIVNPNTAAGSQALQLIVDQNKPPLVVNPTAGKATNLNADRLDGQDSSSFFAVGRSGSNAFCDPQGGDETGGFGGPTVSCASTSLTLPRQARVFVVVESDWNTWASTAPVQGICRLWVDGNPASGAETRPGETTTTSTQDARHNHTGVTHVTGVLPAGSHTFSFDCFEVESDIEFRNVTISAIMLGSG